MLSLFIMRKNILHDSEGNGFVIGDDQTHARPLIIANSFIENGILN